MSDKVTEYFLVWEHSRKELHEAVRKLISEGWEPTGGLAAWLTPSIPVPLPGGGISPSGPKLNLVQAMVKKTND